MCRCQPGSVGGLVGGLSHRRGTLRPSQDPKFSSWTRPHRTTPTSAHTNQMLSDSCLPPRDPAASALPPYRPSSGPCSQAACSQPTLCPPLPTPPTQTPKAVVNSRVKNPRPASLHLLLTPKYPERGTLPSFCSLPQLVMAVPLTFLDPFLSPNVSRY